MAAETRAQAHDRAHLTGAAAALGRAVRDRRKHLRMTQAEVAELAPCGLRTITALEAGKSTARLDVVLAVLAVLGLRLRVERGRPVVVADGD